MKDSALFSIILVLLLLGSLFFVIVQNPEEQIVRSADGEFVLRGLTRDTDLVVSEDHSPGHPDRVSPVYRIDPELSLEHNATIQLVSGVSATGHAFARYDKETNTWYWLSTEHDRGRFITEALQTGSFALFSESLMVPKEFDTLLLEALEAKPEHAIAADFLYATRLETKGPYLEALGVTAAANCGGQEKQMEHTGDFETSIVDADDGLTRLIIRWEIGQDVCADDVPFMLVR